MVLSSGAVFLCFLVVIWQKISLFWYPFCLSAWINDSFFHFMNIVCIRNTDGMVETSYNIVTMF